MTGISTWMAGWVNTIASYDRLFWREAGLSDDAMIRRGLRIDIHDPPLASVVQ